MNSEDRFRCRNNPFFFHQAPCLVLLVACALCLVWFFFCFAGCTAEVWSAVIALIKTVLLISSCDLPIHLCVVL